MAWKLSLDPEIFSLSSIVHMYMRHYSYNYWVWRAYSQPLEDHLAEYGGRVEAETAYRLLVDNCLQTQAIVPNKILPGVDTLYSI
jgi:hypothetical protein